MKKIFIFLFFIFLDFISKYFVKQNIVLNDSIQINKFLDLVYVQNYGVSFGLFANFIPSWLLIIIGLIIVLIIIFLMITSNKNFEKLSYFFIIIGAMSNILDRFINSYVVDFISLHYKNFYWPAFNLADIYITIGIIMLLVSIFVKSEDK